MSSWLDVHLHRTEIIPTMKTPFIAPYRVSCSSCGRRIDVGLKNIFDSIHNAKHLLLLSLWVNDRLLPSTTLHKKLAEKDPDGITLLCETCDPRLLAREYSN